MTLRPEIYVTLGRFALACAVFSSGALLGFGSSAETLAAPAATVQAAAPATLTPTQAATTQPALASKANAAAPASGVGAQGAQGAQDSVERARELAKFRLDLMTNPARQTLDSVILPAGEFATSAKSVAVATTPSAQDKPSAPGMSEAGDLGKQLSMQAKEQALAAALISKDREITALRSQLQVAESERLPVGLTALLTGLLAASLGGMAYLWRGNRAVSPAAPEAAAAFVNFPNATPSEGNAVSGASVPPESESLVEINEQEFDRLMASGRAYSGFRKGSLGPPVSGRIALVPVKPAGAAGRLVNSEALAALRAHAGFLLAQGQTEQALEILEHHIFENGESSPAVYLDVLDILHGQGLSPQFRKFRKYREEFNLLFNGQVPEFKDYLQHSKDLEAHPQVLAHIMALWPRPNVLKVIEAAIFRDPWDEHRPQLGLTAFRDLILLHAMALIHAISEKSTAGVAQALDLDLTQPDPKTGVSEHREGVPSWRVDFQNTAPGGEALSGSPRKLAADEAMSLAARNLIDFELPPEEGRELPSRPAAA